MKMKSSMIVLLMFAIALLLAGDVFAADQSRGLVGRRPSLYKADGTPNATLLNINNFSVWYNSSGEQERNPSTGNAGATYPRGTSTCIYSAGLIWGGRVNDGKSPVIRVNGQSYSNGTAAGAITDPKNSIYELGSSPDVRIWRIRRDYATADLRQDAAEFYTKALASVTDGDVLAIRAEYEKDWREWPAQKGAPFYDKNSDGVYSPKFLTVQVNGVFPPDTAGEEPGLAGADQVVWYVANDIAPGTSPWQSPPIGMEMQSTFWGYNRTDALGNMVFKKFRLIYKGTKDTPQNATIDNMYMCQWSDPDLGDSGDDFAGCDTNLSMGFVYNSKTLDAEYRKFNIAPPAAGYDFLQGPVKKTGVLTDSAVFDLRYRKGYKNLPMTSFIYFAAGGKYSDPPFTAPGCIQWYNMLQGMTPTPQAAPEFLVNPINGLPTTYWLSGDPVSGNSKTDWLDGSIDPPGDRRFLLTAGPFNMAVGDTQELVSSLIAGLGSDRISSVSVMKFYDKTAQAAYDNLFDLPKPPPAPTVTATELNKGVVIEWESNTAGVALTENTVSKGYRFEGYNVYQLPSASSPLTSGVKIATYDLVTDPSTISQQEFDPASGQVLVLPVELGKNSGLTRYMYITNDVIKNAPLVNGQKYYFAVTAYSYNGDTKLVTHSFECSPVVMIVTPHAPNPGTVLPYNVTDTVSIPVKNVVGNNDAYVHAVVLNPSLQTGQSYDIWYGGTGPLRNATIVRQISGTDYATVTATLDTLPSLSPKMVIPAKGQGTFTLNDAKTQISYFITFSGLNGTPGTHTAVIRDTLNKKYLKTLTLVNDTARGVWSKLDGTEALADSLIPVFTSGNMYVIAYDSVYKKGVVRGKIADGLVPRFDLPIASPTVQLVKDLGAFEARIPQDGISFYLSQAPLGYKSCSEYAPGTGNVVDVVNPGGTYKMIGPASAWAGNRANELPVEIRFTDPTDTNWAVATFPSPNDSPAKAKFIRVPFATYLNNVRVWPVVFLNNATDTVWSTVGNDATKGPAFNNIAINDTTDGTKSIGYLSWTTFPPSNSTAKKVPLIQGTSFIALNIVFVDVKATGNPPPAGTKIRLNANISVKIGDIKTFTVNALQTANFEAAKQAVKGINVFPNPYYGVNASEISRDVRFVTFNHLPRKVTIRIFNLAGVLVRKLDKDEETQFLNWDLNNSHNLPVASGIYLAYVDMGLLGTKTLKVAIIQEQQFLQNY
jgi:hypothetical protein